MALPHRLGFNSSYDADMDFVESLVECKKFPMNEDIQYGVFSVYQGKLYEYFHKFKSMVQSDRSEASKYFGLYSLFEEDIPNPKDLVRHQQTFDDMMDSLRYEYNKSKRVNPESILNAFRFLGGLMCGDSTATFSSSEETFSSSEKSKNWVLPNNIGLFGLNTYLYAYFNNIFLVGMPDRLQIADNVLYCPRQFLQHDAQHTRDIQSTIFKAKKEFYYRIWQMIIIDSDISILEKENHILNIWLPIHEGFFRSAIENYFQPTIFKYSLSTIGLIEFLPDRLKMSSLVFTPEIIDLYLTQEFEDETFIVAESEIDQYIKYNYNDILKRNKMISLEDRKAVQFITILCVLYTINYLRHKRE